MGGAGNSIVAPSNNAVIKSGVDLLYLLYSRISRYYESNKKYSNRYTAFNQMFVHGHCRQILVKALVTLRDDVSGGWWSWDVATTRSCVPHVLRLSIVQRFSFSPRFSLLFIGYSGHIRFFSSLTRICRTTAIHCYCCLKRHHPQTPWGWFAFHDFFHVLRLWRSIFVDVDFSNGTVSFSRFTRAVVVMALDVRFELIFWMLLHTP